MFWKLKAQLASLRSIWTTLVVTLALSAAFVIVMQIFGFAIIDTMRDPVMVRDHVDAMTRDQRMAHAWLTVTADVIYPFAYAALFAGLSLRYLGRAGPVFALIAAAAVPADLAENFVQVVILHGGFFMLPTKAVLTPVKYTCVGIASFGAILALIVALLRRLSR